MLSVTGRSIRLIAVDDDPAALHLLEALVPNGVSFKSYLSGRECLDRLGIEEPDIVVLDLMLPDLSGIDVLKQIKTSHPRIEVILLTADYSTESAVAAIKAGASDYLTKPVESDRFHVALNQSLQAIRRHKELRIAERDLAAKCSFAGMIGRSQAIRNVFDLVRRIAPHFRAVLVTGASGTGKELVAQALHAHSNHKGGPYVVCNCAAIPETLVEAELFGSRKGAYTSSISESVGYFGQASGGTLVLDECEALPLTAQAALLRAVQFGEVQRLGSAIRTEVDVRIIACTNRDLRAAVRTGTFREDLFFRLSAFELMLPALVDRREDVPLLIRHFLDRVNHQMLKQIVGFTAAAQRVLLEYSWPGNVRELEQAVHYAAVMSGSPLIDVGDLPPQIKISQTRTPVVHPVACNSLAQFQSQYVLDVLSETAGDKREAVKRLGVSRATLYRLLSRCKERFPESLE